MPRIPARTPAASPKVRVVLDTVDSYTLVAHLVFRIEVGVDPVLALEQTPKVAPPAVTEFVGVIRRRSIGHGSDRACVEEAQVVGL